MISNPGKRRLLVAAAGAAAAAAGAGAYLWRSGSGNPDVDSAAVSAFWQSSFNQPDGRPLAMAGLRGAPLVLNFWATWCPPCVREMPEIDRFARQFASEGVRVVGLAIDNAAPVREFLARAPVSYSIVLAAAEGAELSRRLGNQRGGLPFTAFFDRRGKLAQRKLGETTAAELARWVKRS